LFTGAQTIKTAADVALWGGLAGEQMDVCYHDPCDSLRPEADNAPPGVHAGLAATGFKLYGNLNTYAFDVNADAAATAIVKFAYDTSTVVLRPHQRLPGPARRPTGQTREGRADHPPGPPHAPVRSDTKRLDHPAGRGVHASSRARAGRSALLRQAGIRAVGVDVTYCFRVRFIDVSSG